MNPDKVLKPSLDKPEHYSLSGTIGWMLALTIGVGTLIKGLIAGPMVYLGYEISAVNAFLGKPSIAFLAVLLSLAVAYPLLKIATHHSLEKGLPLDFLAIKPVSFSPLAKWAVLAVTLGATQSLLLNWLEVPRFEVVQELIRGGNSLGPMILFTLNTCLLAPVLIEFVFRGMAYRRIEQSRFGIKGAIVIPTLVFVAVQMQYSWHVIVSVLPTALLLGFVRYKTGNLVNCMLIHIMMNVLALVFTLS